MALKSSHLSWKGQLVLLIASILKLLSLLFKRLEIAIDWHDVEIEKCGIVLSFNNLIPKTLINLVASSYAILIASWIALSSGHVRKMSIFSFDLEFGSKSNTYPNK